MFCSARKQSHLRVFQDLVWGVAFEIGQEDEDMVRRHLDHRERGGYTKETVTFYPEDKTEKEIVLDLYIGTEDNPNYLGPAPLDDIAQTICTSVGPSGKNVDYLMNLTHALRTLLPEKEDSHLSDLEERVKKLQVNGHHI